MILRNKEKMHTNQKSPKYFVQWEERDEKGVIRTNFRVYEQENNQKALFSALSLDPQITDLYYGTGRPNNTRTVMKIDTRVQFERSNNDIHATDETEGDDESSS